MNQPSEDIPKRDFLSLTQKHRKLFLMKCYASMPPVGNARLRATEMHSNKAVLGTVPASSRVGRPYAVQQKKCTHKRRLVNATGWDCTNCCAKGTIHDHRMLALEPSLGRCAFSGYTGLALKTQTFETNPNYADAPTNTRKLCEDP